MSIFNSHASSVERTFLRDLLCDTTLQVSLLARDGKIGSVADLRQRSQDLIREFKEAMDERGVTSEIRDEVVYAQCGLIDEAALMYLTAEERAAWETHPLQVEYFGNHDAGERVYDNLANRMSAPSPNVAVLEFYAAILGLGFKGRLAFADETERTALIAALDERIEAISPSTPGSFHIDRARRFGLGWLSAFSPWASATLACLVAGVTYLACSHILDSPLSGLLARKP
jgi:type VI secretion system protein ImpK